MNAEIEQLHRLIDSLRAKLANEHDTRVVGDLLRDIVRHETRLTKLERAVGTHLPKK